MGLLLSVKSIFCYYFANVCPLLTDCSVGLLDSRPQEALLCAKAKRQRQMFYLRESEATATNVLSVRERSDSNKCFICATATNVLSVRKRSDSNKCFICAKAKRQRQMFYLRESEASATNVLSVRRRSDSNKASSP
ncbi:hypothetical protein [Lysinibacillus sp. RS5]|uniref:hypothetical protein n=1 Tax=unclassified Lysinibacillus TaxID=2636778 RepID=UPI0035BE3E8F